MFRRDAFIINNQNNKEEISIIIIFSWLTAAFTCAFFARKVWSECAQSDKTTTKTNNNPIGDRRQDQAGYERCNLTQFTLTNRVWFSVVCTLIDNEYASSQWSKCCGRTRLRSVSPQHYYNSDNAYSLSIRVQTTLIRFVKKILRSRYNSDNIWECCEEHSKFL